MTGPRPTPQSSNKQLTQGRFRSSEALSCIALSALCFWMIFGLFRIPDTIAAPSEFPVWWSPSLHLSSLKGLAEKLDEPVNMDTNDPGLDVRDEDQHRRRVFTCSQYILAIGEGFFASSSYDEAMESFFSERCYVLRDLRRARPAKRSYVLREKWSPKALSELPPLLQVGDGSLMEKVDKARAARQSWQSFDPSLKVQNRGHDHLFLYVEDESDEYSLQILATGDFNGDGVEDIAVSGSVRAKQGTYHGNFYYILTRDAWSQCLRLITEDRPPFRLHR